MVTVAVALIALLVGLNVFMLLAWKEAIKGWGRTIKIADAILAEWESADEHWIQLLNEALGMTRSEQQARAALDGGRGG